LRPEQSLLGEQAGRVVVFVYHSVHPRRPGACATPQLFAEHLRWLKANCVLIRLGDVPAALGDTHADRPRVAITFDDGLLDNYEHAFPLLSEFGVPATIYLTAGFLEGDPRVVEHMQWLADDSENVHPMSWQQVREMQAAGIEFGCHTYGHGNLAHMDGAAVESDLVRSRQTIEGHLGERVASMAYPFGRIRRHFTRQTMDIVETLGFDYAAAVALRQVREADWPFAIPRFFVARDDLHTFEGKVRGVYDRLGRFQEALPLWMARRLDPEDFVM